jgi:putative endonuclease
VAAARGIPDLFGSRGRNASDNYYYLYIMSSASRTLYTGIANDLERRSMEHKEAKPGSFMARYKVNQLVDFEHFSDIDQASDYETEIKKMAPPTKVRLIESMNPDWLDLSQPL